MNNANFDHGPRGYDGPLPRVLPNGAFRQKSASELAREMRQAAFARNDAADSSDFED